MGVMNQKGVLYICATPIGNKADLTHRAKLILEQVSVILAEDTRVTGQLLAHYNIHTPMMRMDQHTEKHRMDWVVTQLHQGHSLALVSDAGTPSVCDPGAGLVAHVRQNGGCVVPIPGASALVTLQSVAPIDVPYIWIGWVPRRPSDWHRWLTVASRMQLAIAAFESPNRLRKRLLELAESFPHSRVILGKELTKSYEQIWDGSVETVLLEIGDAPKGEWVMIVEPTVTPQWNNQLAELATIGLTRSQFLAVATQMGVPKNVAYVYVTQHLCEGVFND